MGLYNGNFVLLNEAREKFKPYENRIKTNPSMDIEEMDEIIRVGDLFGASDICFQVGEPVWFEIHGEWCPVTTRPFGKLEMELFLSRNYDPIGPGEVNQRGRPIDHAFVVKPLNDDDRKIRIRLNATGGRDPSSDSAMSASGVQSSLRVLPGVPPRLSQFGVEQAIVDGFKLGPGLTIVTGPTGSGKTTLLGGAIRHLAEDPKNSAKICEYSAPIELIYDDLDFPRSFIHQVEVGRALKIRPEEGGNSMLWASCVANAMRRKPGLILIGEARDGATIEGCVLASTTGHGVMTTMHTIGVAETIRRAIMSIPSEQRAGVAIDLMQMSNMYVTQLLVPKKGGGRIAIREYIKFDAASRREIMKHSVDEWTTVVQDLMRNKEVECQRMIDAAQDAYDKGLIDDEHLEYLSARQREVDRKAKNSIDLNGPQVGSELGVNFVPDMDEGRYDFENATPVK